MAPPHACRSRASSRCLSADVVVGQVLGGNVHHLALALLVSEHGELLHHVDRFLAAEIGEARRPATAVEAMAGYAGLGNRRKFQIERRPPRLDLDTYPHLPRARVKMSVLATMQHWLRGPP